MNLKQLEAFVKVAEDGSFSKAAKALFLTQPTISAHISSLEKELNARLFVRNTKEVSLSDDGKELYQYASQMVELEKKIEEIFSEESRKDTKCITIASSTIPAQYILPGILTSFNEKFPTEQFKVMEMDSSKVIEMVVGHMADIGFTGTVLEKKHCKYIPFYNDELVLITPNNEKFRNYAEEKENLEWLRVEGMIMREEGSGTRKEAEKLLKSIGIMTEELNVVATIENAEAIKRSVRSGMGVTVISRLAAQEEIEAGYVLEFKLAPGGGGRDLNIVYNKNYHLSTSAERFLKVVKKMYS